MSLFDQNLDKGGNLKDVVKVVGFTYANGLHICHQGYYADETIKFDPWRSDRISEEKYNENNIICSSPEIDRFSHWPIMHDGFLCNCGKIEYSQIFGENLHYLDSLPDVALNGHIETLFVPFFVDSSRDFGCVVFGSDEEYVDTPRLIKHTDWWKLVESGLKEGIENVIDPKVNASVFVSGGDPWVDPGAQRVFRDVFYITIKIYSHEDIGDIFWPYNDYEDYDRPGQLFGIEQGYWDNNIWRGYSYRPQIGSPVSITTRLELRRINTK